MGYNTYPANPWPLNSEQAQGGGSQYELPIAEADTLGGVKVGTGLSIDAETGVLSNSNPTPYSLPTAAADTLGGVKVGSGLSIDDGVLSAFTSMTLKTKTYVGTGTTANAIDFGEETPNHILCIIVDPEDGDVSGLQYLVKVENIVWGGGYATGYYITNNGDGTPQALGGGSTTRNLKLEYSGNVLTITGSDAINALNQENIHYIVKYL